MFLTSSFEDNLISSLTCSLHYVVFKVQPASFRRGTFGIIAVLKPVVNDFFQVFQNFFSAAFLPLNIVFSIRLVHNFERAILFIKVHFAASSRLPGPSGNVRYSNTNFSVSQLLFMLKLI